jgi:hypothetical protein
MRNLKIEGLGLRARDQRPEISRSRRLLQKFGVGRDSVEGPFEMTDTETENL